jgi:hypothetical protein
MTAGKKSSNFLYKLFSGFLELRVGGGFFRYF